MSKNLPLNPKWWVKGAMEEAAPRKSPRAVLSHLAQEWDSANPDDIGGAQMNVV
jgi:hypothetical protein